MGHVRTEHKVPLALAASQDGGLGGMPLWEGGFLQWGEPEELDSEACLSGFTPTAPPGSGMSHNTLLKLPGYSFQICEGRLSMHVTVGPKVFLGGYKTHRIVPGVWLTTHQWTELLYSLLLRLQGYYWYSADKTFTELRYRLCISNLKIQNLKCSKIQNIFENGHDAGSSGFWIHSV